MKRLGIVKIHIATMLCHRSTTSSNMRSISLISLESDVLRRSFDRNKLLCMDTVCQTKTERSPWSFTNRTRQQLLSGSTNGLRSSQTTYIIQPLVFGTNNTMLHYHFASHRTLVPVAAPWQRELAAAWGPKTFGFDDLDRGLMSP